MVRQDQTVIPDHRPTNTVGVAAACEGKATSRASWGQRVLAITHPASNMGFALPAEAGQAAPYNAPVGSLAWMGILQTPHEHATGGRWESSFGAYQTSLATLTRAPPLVSSLTPSSTGSDRAIRFAGGWFDPGSYSRSGRRRADHGKSGSAPGNSLSVTRFYFRSTNRV